MKITKLVLSLFILAYSISSYSQQRVVISDKDNQQPHASAVLDLISDERGFLLPRMDSDSRDAINDPAESLMILNTTNKCIEIWVEEWHELWCVDCAKPWVPTATAAENIEEDSFTAKWDAVISDPAVTHYILDVSEDIDFSTYIIEEENVGNVTEYQVTDLDPATEYYYRVFAVNECGSSYASNVISVETEPGVCDGFEFEECGDELCDPRDGQFYATVEIGNQCWFAENLNYGTFADVHDDGQESGEKFCQDLNGNNNSGCPMGGLYEWGNMMDGASSSNSNPSGVQGLCPEGWHVPSDAEWCELEETLEPGGAIWCNTVAWRGNNVGGDMKETGTTHWDNPNDGATNNSGFTGLPGGHSEIGLLLYNGSRGYFWSSRDSGATHAWGRQLQNNETGTFRVSFDKNIGFSIRCVKD